MNTEQNSHKIKTHITYTPCYTQPDLFINKIKLKDK